MANQELTKAFVLLDRTRRFQHVWLPTDMYPGSVGTHTVEVYSFINSFRETYPKPNSIRWRRALSIATHHDEREKFFGDRVAFDPEVSQKHRSQQIMRTVQWLRQNSEIGNQILSYEYTVDILKGRSQLALRPRDEIIVAIEDLKSGAQQFHLETVRGRHLPDFERYYPLPDDALVYGPKMLLRYRARIPYMTRDRVFTAHAMKALTDSLHQIIGWWDYLAKEEPIPPALANILERAKSAIPPFRRRFPKFTSRGGA